MADLIISQLPSFAAGLLVDGDLFPFTDISASETKKIEAKQLFDQGVLLLSAKQIPADKVDLTFAPNTIDGSALVDSTVGGVKLADNATTLVGDPLPNGEFVGQFGLESSTNKLFYWSGAAWEPFRASGSLYNVAVNNAGSSEVLLGQSVANGVATLSADLRAATAGNLFVASPDGSAGSMSYRAILGADLPIPTASDRGAVSINGNGLKLSGSQLEIDNSVAASTDFHIVTYDANGLVTGGRALSGVDLPLATSASPGAVLPGPSLSVTPTGQLNHSNTIAPGTAAKVQYDGSGHITQGLPLSAADIPDLDFAKITSGTIAPGQLGDKAILSRNVGDYATSYIQENEPPISTIANHIGMLWFQESSGALRMWNGNSWFPIGFGRLAHDNLRWGGLFDADTGTISGLTDFGTQAGLAVGQVLPAAGDQYGGLYFVCDTPGNQTGVTPGVTYDAGDWCLCVNRTGWVRIDTLNGGGGGSVSFLSDLLDVTLIAPKGGHALVFDPSSGGWTNKEMALKNLLDVDLATTPQVTDDLLKFDGVKWVPVASTALGPITSVHGRVGAVVAEEGDYAIDQLSDVTITMEAVGDVLRYDGAGWINIIATDAAIPDSVVARDANGDISVNVVTADVFNIDALPALP